MADCLSFLRLYNIEKKDVIETDERIIFGDYSWSKFTNTNYLKYGTGRDGATKEYYTLASLVFLLKNVDLPHSVYAQKAIGSGLPLVSRPDRKDLLAYLNGETSTSASIDKSAPLELGQQHVVPPAPLSQVKRSLEDGTNSDASKRVKADEDIKVDKNRLEARLEANVKDKVVTTNQLRPLSERMSAEKIAALKAKRIAHKRETIKDDTITEIEQRSFADAEVDVSKDIISKEKVVRTRETVMRSAKKSFTNILDVITNIQLREQGRSFNNNHKASPSVVVPKKEPPPKKPVAPIPYNRYDQERFAGKEETEGFKIDTMGTYRGMNFQSVTAGVTGSKRRPDPSQKEMPTSIAKPLSVNQPKSGHTKRESRTPIIVVPATVTSIITLLNVKDFLQDFKFISNKEKKANGAPRESEVLVQRKKDVGNASVTIPFKVVDSVNKLQKNDWERVVAVFVQGPTWQFKGWPWLQTDNSPVNIFAKVKGFHLKFEDSRIESNIQKWDVHILQINRHKRHLDRACALRFWEVLDKFVGKQNKTGLRY